MSGRIYWLSWERAAETADEAKAIVDGYHGRPPEELCHVANDVRERHNLASDPGSADQLRAMRELRDTRGWTKQGIP